MVLYIGRYRLIFEVPMRMEQSVATPPITEPSPQHRLAFGVITILSGAFCIILAGGVAKMLVVAIDAVDAPYDTYVIGTTELSKLIWNNPELAVGFTVACAFIAGYYFSAWMKTFDD